MRKGSSSAACVSPCIFIYVACPLPILVDPGGKRESCLAQNGVAFLGRMIASGKSVPYPFLDSLARENRPQEYKKGQVNIVADFMCRI